jgi:fructokinase
METLRIGIDLGGTKTEAVALDRASGAELARLRVPTSKGDYAATLSTIRELVEALESRLGGRGSVGIGIPGTVSPATGLVKNANSTWLIGKPFDRDLAQVLGRPVRVANDADCFALSEATDGAGAGAGIVFGVILGTGVGAGIVANGRLLAGPNAIAGEWGHNPLPWPADDERPGPDCYCGRQGCVETFLSGPALERQHGEGLAVPAIVRLHDQGDPRARLVLDRYCGRLARALAVVINILDPHVIVLGGGVGNVEMLCSVVPTIWGQWIFSDHVVTRLVRPVHGDSSGVRGAAWLWPA